MVFVKESYSKIEIEEPLGYWARRPDDDDPAPNAAGNDCGLVSDLSCAILGTRGVPAVVSVWLGRLPTLFHTIAPELKQLSHNFATKLRSIALYPNTKENELFSSPAPPNTKIKPMERRRPSGRITRMRDCCH
jgi:hypothetical protein